MRTPRRDDVRRHARGTVVITALLAYVLGSDVSLSYVPMITASDGTMHVACWEARWGVDYWSIGCADGFVGP